MLTELRNALADANDSREQLNRRLQAREVNASEARSRLEQVERRSAELPVLNAAIDVGGAPGLLEASQWQVEAERRALAAERQALQALLGSQPVRYRLYATQRAELTQRVGQFNERIGLVEQRLSRLELAALQPEAVGIDPSHPAYAVAGVLSDESVALWYQRAELNQLVRRAQHERGDVERRRKLLAERMATARRLVGFASDSDALGAALLVHWREINAYGDSRDDTESRLQAIGDTVIARIRGEERLAELASASGYVSDLLDDAQLDLETLVPSTAHRNFVGHVATRSR